MAYFNRETYIIEYENNCWEDLIEIKETEEEIEDMSYCQVMELIKFYVETLITKK